MANHFNLSINVIWLSCDAGLSIKVYALFADKKADYDVKVSGVEIVPYPIARGNPASFCISASTGAI